MSKAYLVIRMLLCNYCYQFSCWHHFREK